MQKTNLKNITNKNFILLLICISIIFLSISIFSALSHSNLEYISKTKKKEFLIYSYQMQKITQNGNFDTILLGDSSLGNGINNQIFSDQDFMESVVAKLGVDTKDEEAVQRKISELVEMGDIENLKAKLSEWENKQIIPNNKWHFNSIEGELSVVLENQLESNDNHEQNGAKL